METNSLIPKPEDRFFDSNGVPIWFIIQGSGPSVVLLHGMTDNIDNWVKNGFFAGLLDGYQLIAMDCRGHGQSGKPHDPAAYGREMVGDVVRLLDHLGIARAHLIGHSMGAEIALKMASLYPARVRSAVLAGSGWSDDSVYEVLGFLAEGFDRGEGFRAYFEWATPPGRSRTVDETTRFEKWNQAMLARNDASAMAALCRSYTELEGLLVTEEEVRGIQTPMLGVTGEFDRERPMLERMQGVAPSFALIVLEGQGHGGRAFFDALARLAASFFHGIYPAEGSA